MTLLVSTALAWTCAEATHIHGNAPIASFAATELRDGWSYSKDELRCMQRGGVPGELVGRLHRQEGEPIHLEASGTYTTVVLDLGCGTLRVTGHDDSTLVVDGFHAGNRPFLEPHGETITVRRDVAYQVCTNLTVQAPRNARLLVHHRGSHVVVHGMAGPVEINAPQADIAVVGPSEIVEAETLRGDVYIDVAGSVQVDSGQGQVAIGTGPGATARITTVSGAQFVWGGPLRRLEASSVDGDIRSLATLLPEAVVDARSQNGDVLIGVGPAQAALLPRLTVRPPDLLHDTPAGSMRPDRSLPGGTPTAYAHFEALPVAVRALWSPRAPARELWPATGAWVRGDQQPDESTARVVAHSLTGFASAAPLPEQVPRAMGATLSALTDRLGSLAACRADLGEPVLHGEIDLWARLVFRDGAPTSVTFDTEGFDPAITRCVHKAMMGWTIPDAREVVVDWPLKLRLVRSTPPPP